MALRIANTLGLKLLQESTGGLLAPLANTANVQFVRHRRVKHWIPKWKQLRRLKVMKPELPNFNESWTDLTEEQIRSKFKEQGMLPPRPWVEKQYFISNTGGIFEPYVPPEGDGKVSPITTQGAKQSLEFLSKKSKTMMAVRKIRQYEEEFDSPEFCKEATGIYVKLHECMGENDMDKIVEYATERALPEIIHNVKNKTLRWKYIKDVELPRIVHARCTDVVTKQNIFAQITVRFHTQQTLAVYDRFGRLIHGSEIIAKDVLEYVVFEKHLANQYGKWRIHAKIIPDWLPPKEPTPLTYKLLPEPVKDNAVTEAKVAVPAETDLDKPTPALA